MFLPLLLFVMGEKNCSPPTELSWRIYVSHVLYWSIELWHTNKAVLYLRTLQLFHWMHATVSISLVPIIPVVWYHSILLAWSRGNWFRSCSVSIMSPTLPFLSCGLKLSKNSFLTVFTMRINLPLEFLTYTSGYSFL